MAELAEGLRASTERMGNAPPTREAFAAMLQKETAVVSALIEKTLGPSTVSRLQAELARDERYGTPLELAFFADVITVERCAEEVKLAQAIERELERLMRVLRDLKKWKREEREREISGSPLLPPYMRRIK